jgi:hypothetical protein
MKTPMQELIDRIKLLKYSEVNEQAWDAYDAVMDLAESLLKKEKEQIVEAWVHGDNSDCLSEQDSSNFAEQYYNETFNTEEMTREEKLETIVKVFAKIMFYGDWEWETPNERVITMLMQEVGMYPFKDEDDMIFKTPVNDELYKKAIKEVPSRQVKGWDESVPVKTNEK